VSLLAELKRRRVFRALIGYGIAAFAVLQIIEPLMHALRWPDAVLGYVVVALALGFPIVVAIAWIFDVGAAPESNLSRTRVALALAFIGVLAGAPGVAWYFVLRRPAPPQDRSIAVLPFANLGGERESAWFADGLHDELLRQISRLGDLQVISRTSVLQYKDGARNLREIGEALGVSTIVEGSVQRAGNHVRVEARLLDARRDRQLWAESYDRDLTDVFAIESAITEEIAHALHAKLSAAQTLQLARKPTQSLEAYDLYLRAIDYDQDHRPDMRPADLAISEDLFRQAIALDSSFALARARLAISLLHRFWWVAGTPRVVLEEARHETEEARRLDRDLPQTHLALGYLHYYGERHFEEALREFEAARNGAPGEALPAIAYVQRRLGKFEEAIRNLRETVPLDPRSSPLLLSLAETLEFVRRYPDAERFYNQALRITPDSDSVRIRLAHLYEKWKGERDMAKKVLLDVAPRLDPQARFAALSFVIILMWHNPPEALEVLRRVPAETFAGGRAVYPRALLAAFAHEALGDASVARIEYKRALPALEEAIRKDPRPAQYSALALDYAGLGRKKDALEAARRGLDLLPLSQDAMFGAFQLIDLALVEARVGEMEAAIRDIDDLLSRPSYLSPGLLRIDPRWQPLYGEARFRKLAEMDAAQALGSRPQVPR